VSFDRFALAWIAAIIFILCGCQFGPSPSPHVQIDIGNHLQVPDCGRVIVAAPRQEIVAVQAPSVAIDGAAGEPPAIPDEPAREPFSLEPPEFVPALEPSRAEPTIAVAPEQPPAFDWPPARPIAMIHSGPGQPPSAPAATQEDPVAPAQAAREWESLPSLPNASPVQSESIGEELPANAEGAAAPAKRGFPWFTILALLAAAGVGAYHYFFPKGFHVGSSLASSPAKVAPSPPHAAGAAANLHPV
jgi:hypothetical protein